ncbi:hypothetical protein C8R43DRAFT_1241202 [Mycena crocata]|nr:hypothetical protein C8R43DRAFT_1241202 [Mycena crocata]
MAVPRFGLIATVTSPSPSPPARSPTRHASSRVLLSSSTRRRCCVAPPPLLFVVCPPWHCRPRCATSLNAVLRFQRAHPLRSRCMRQLSRTRPNARHSQKNIHPRSRVRLTAIPSSTHDILEHTPNIPLLATAVKQSHRFRLGVSTPIPPTSQFPLRLTHPNVGAQSIWI